MKRKNDDASHSGMELRSGKIIRSTQNELPYNIYEEILTSVNRLKDILSLNNRFESDFGNKIIELLLLIGKDKGIYRQDIDELINLKYPLQPGQVLLRDAEVDERSALYEIAFNLMHLIIGDHKKIFSKKIPVLREDIEKAIISFFYGLDVDEKLRKEIQSSFLVEENVDISISGMEETGLIGSDQVCNLSEEGT